MADNLTVQERSEIMRRVVSKGTRPELTIRKIVWGLGYRYRLNVNGIPGKPDIAFKSRKKAIFVNGCFWHRHPGCILTRTPKSNTEFWTKKFATTVKTDQRNYEELTRMGWTYLIIWECEIKKSTLECLTQKIDQFMKDGEIGNAKI